jgi:hypothetical protein
MTAADQGSKSLHKLSGFRLRDLPTKWSLAYSKRFPKGPSFGIAIFLGLTRVTRHYSTSLFSNEYRVSSAFVFNFIFSSMRAR